MTATRPPRSVALAAMGLVVIGLVGLLGPRAHGQAAGFEASAAAEGIRVGVALPGDFIEQVVDVGAPVSQAVVDGIGNSRAFASHPYPGELVLTGPALVASLSGLPSPPSYPLIAESAHPIAPKATVSQPAYELSAESDEHASTAKAVAGGASGSTAVALTKTSAKATRDPRSGTITAEATSEVEVLSFEGVLRVGGTRAYAKATRTGDGTLRRASDFRVDTVSIAGQAVGLDEKGLVVAGTTTPLPDSSPLAQILDEARLSVSYLAPVEDADGIVSAGVLITQEQDVPNGPKVATSYVLGRATAHAAGTAAPLLDGAGPVAIEAPLTGGDPAATSFDASPLPAATARRVAADRDAGLTAPPPMTSSDPKTEAETDGVATPPTTPVNRIATQASAESFYVMLVVAGFLGLGGAQLIRILGVRLAWTS